MLWDGRQEVHLAGNAVTGKTSFLILFRTTATSTVYCCYCYFLMSLPLILVLVWFSLDTIVPGQFWF